MSEDEYVTGLLDKPRPVPAVEYLAGLIVVALIVVLLVVAA